MHYAAAMGRWAVTIGLVAASCGTIREAPHDAGLDAAIDAADAAIPRGQVDVTVLEGGDPVVAAFAFYHDRDGLVVADGVTDQDGKVSFSDVPDNGVVTVVRDPAERVLVSIWGARIDDQLTLDTPMAGFLPLPGSAGTIQITFPPDSADSYVADATCRRGDKIEGAPSAVVNLDISDRCPDLNDIDVVVYGVTGGQRISYQSSKAVSVGANITYLSAGAVVSYQVAPPAVAAAASAEIIPLADSGRAWDTETIALTISPESAPPFVFSRAGGDLFGLMRSRLVLEPEMQPDGLTVSQELIQLTTPSMVDGDTVSIDASNHFPFLSTFELVSNDPVAIDYAADNALECGSAGVPDVIGLYVTAALPGDEFATWTLIAPGDSASPLRLPKLTPVGEAQFWPHQAFLSVAANVRLIAFSAKTWDEYRHGPGIDDLNRKEFLLVPGESVCTATATIVP